MGSPADDWIDLWHSEWAALAFDREAAETWQAGVGLWAEAARLGLAAMAPTPHDPAGRAGSAAAAWAPALAAAPDAGGAARLADAIESLARRLDELERRLARLEPGGDAGGAGPG